MASFNIHLAVAKIYAKKNNINNISEFLDGSIAPDLADNKDITHYSDRKSKEFLTDYLQGKTILPRFLSQNIINTDYEKGVFLHLITDYLFFNDFFDKDYISSITYNEFIKDLYFSYEQINEYLKEKYNIDLTKYETIFSKNIDKDNREKKVDKIGAKNIIEYEKIDKFIERVSNIDLEEYKERLVNANCNVLPE